MDDTIHDATVMVTITGSKGFWTAALSDDHQQVDEPPLAEATGATPDEAVAALLGKVTFNHYEDKEVV